MSSEEGNSSERFKNPVADLDEKDSGNWIKPGAAYLIRNERKFFCPDYNCKDEERILLVVRPNDPFFRHRAGDYEHEIGPETLLHRAAIKWFVGLLEFEIPPIKWAECSAPKQVINLDPSKTITEYNRLKVIIPDVKLCSINGFDFAVEIVVTNDVSDPKKKLIEEFGLPVVRVDLQFFFKTFTDQCRGDLDFINARLPKLMTNPELKSWVLPPAFEQIKDKIILNEESPTPPSSDGIGWLLAILTLGLIYLFREKD